ncbi:MAG: hypothetical protein DMG10_01180 [Acidobacteria bacterium]|nr:MAG: hypothetical protein DMG10_01180 [Acidobacteriota bacterium]PYV41659.1 MAG: hypothetical protein DMG09_04235 [Acidobacteriota bacterium]
MNIAFAILTAIALTVWDPAPLGSLDSLRGIEWVSVILDDEDPGIEAKEAGLTLELLRADVTAKLRAGGMKLEEGSASPQLGLLVAHLEYKAIRPSGGGPPGFVAYVCLRVKQDVQLLSRAEPAPMLASTWEHGTLITGNGPGKEEVRKALAALADKFLADYRAANSEGAPLRNPPKP